MVDLWWEGARLIWEEDGTGPHGTQRVSARDRGERQDALRRLYPDVSIARFTCADLRRPGYILESVKGEERGDLTEMEQ